MKSFNVFQTFDELNKAAIKYIITIAKKSIHERGKFIIALSGGETPQKLYLLLSEPYYNEQIKWEKTFIFWGDERWVPLDDKRNNAHQAKSILLDKIKIPASNIHRIPVNLSPNQAASIYEKEIKDFFRDEAYEALLHAKFDLILLGLGENGHTASLFPETKVLNDKAEGVRFIEENPPVGGRITMTAPLINQARHILFLVTGIKKAEILKMVINGSYQPEKYPAQLIKPVNGELVWFIDKAAASLMNI